MRDVLIDQSVESKAGMVYTPNDAEAARIRDRLEGQQICPFCGDLSDGSQVICPKCTMENTAVARKATKMRIGPWSVLQNRNPAAPGMKWETLLTFVRKGRVHAQSIVRGPTTHQLWRFAAHVKGLSREFGICYSCGGAIEQGANLCTHCNRLQEPPAHPDTLLDTGEGESRLPVYKEIGPSNDELAARAILSRQSLDANAEAEQRRLKESAEALARQQQKFQEIAAREKDVLEREKQGLARERDAIVQAREAITRDRQAIAREQEAIARERAVIAREREALAEVQKTLAQDQESLPAAPQHEDALPQVEETLLPAEETSPNPEPLASTPEVRDTPATAAPKAPTVPPITWKPSLAPEKPFANPPVPLPPRARDGFLSAKDLAAAFKLNLAPAAEYGPPQALPLADSPTDMEEAFLIAQQLSRPPKAKSRKGRKVLLFLLLLIVGIAVALALRPDWRKEASSEFAHLTDQLLSKISSRMSPLPEPVDKDDLPENPPSSSLPPTPLPARKPPTTSRTDVSSPSRDGLSPPSPTQLPKNVGRGETRPATPSGDRDTEIVDPALSVGHP